MRNIVIYGDTAETATVSDYADGEPIIRIQDGEDSASILISGDNLQKLIDALIGCQDNQ